MSKLNKKIDILGETKENIIKILRRLKLKEMNEKTPFDYSPKSGKKVWWECSKDENLTGTNAGPLLEGPITAAQSFVGSANSKPFGVSSDLTVTEGLL